MTPTCSHSGSLDALLTLQGRSRTRPRRSKGALGTLSAPSRRLNARQSSFGTANHSKKLDRDVEALEKTFEKAASGRLNSFGTATRAVSTNLWIRATERVVNIYIYIYIPESTRALRARLILSRVQPTVPKELTLLFAKSSG